MTDEQTIREALMCLDDTGAYPALDRLVARLAEVPAMECRIVQQRKRLAKLEEIVTDHAAHYTAPYKRWGERLQGSTEAWREQKARADAAEARLAETEKALVAALSRLTLARASMKACLKHNEPDQIEAWLLAEHDNAWIEEVSAALRPDGAA